MTLLAHGCPLSYIGRAGTDEKRKLLALPIEQREALCRAVPVRRRHRRRRGSSPHWETFIRSNKKSPSYFHIIANMPSPAFTPARDLVGPKDGPGPPGCKNEARFGLRSHVSGNYALGRRFRQVRGDRSPSPEAAAHVWPVRRPACISGGEDSSSTRHVPHLSPRSSPQNPPPPSADDLPSS